MSNKVAIFTDLHLGVHQNSSFWIDVSMDWMNWFKKDLQSKGITTIIFCGDFFHYRDEVSLVTLDTAQKVLEILKEFNILMITGNHDCYYKDTSEVNSLSLFKGWSNITVYDTLTSIERDNKKFTFCPWGTKIDDIPSSDVVFGHFELENFKMNAHRICDHGDDANLLVKKAPLIFSGHFHLRDEKQFGKSTIVYVGNPFEMDFGDSYQRKGYYILDTDKLEYEFIENTFTPRHIKYTLSNLITFSDPEYDFRENIPNNIIKVIIDKNISTEHLDALVAKLTSYKPNELRIDYDVNYNKVKVDSKTELNLSGIVIEQAIEEFINLLDISNKSEVIEYTINLYQRSKL